MKYKSRLERLEQEINPDPGLPIYPVQWVTEEQAAEIRASRPPGRPGHVQFIIVPPEHMPMWFGPLDDDDYQDAD